MKDQTPTHLTGYQRDVWSVGSQAPASPQFNCVLHERLHGEVDRDRLAACIRRALHRHDTFRLRFGDSAGVPFQWVAQGNVPVSVLDLSRESEPEAACAAWMRRSMATALSLTSGFLVEATVLLESPDVTHLHVKAHHIVADGWALNRLSLEIFQEYVQGPDGGPRQGNREAPSYPAFVEEDAAYRVGADSDRDRAFFREYLSSVTPALFTRRASGGPRERGRHTFVIDGALAGRVRAAGFSPFAYVAAMLGTYLTRLHRSEEVVLGVPFLNRPTEHHKDILGQFANTLPLRVPARGGRTLRELLTDIRSATRQLRRHERLALGDVLRAQPAPAHGSRQLFDVTLSYMHWSWPDRIPGVERRPALMAPSHDQDALGVVVSAFDDTADIHVDLDYACEVFDEDFPIASVVGHLTTLLEHGLDLADRPLSDVPMLSPAEHEDLTAGRAHGPQVPYADQATLHGLFEAQVARRPDQTAVIAASGETLTYAELDERANRVARALRAEGVGPDDRVAVMMERGPQLLVALLGILKSGGAYVPVEPGYPAERVDFLLRDSRAKVLIVDDDAPAGLPEDVTVRHVSGLLTGSGASVEPLATSRDLAYVIYTSGSTGQPKGVMVEHHSVVNRLAWMQRRYPLGGRDVLLQKTPVSFDVSVWELFWWAVEGASVALLPPGGQRDPREILRAVRGHGVTAVHFVPSTLGPFLDLLEESATAREGIATLRYVFCSGEALPAARVEQFTRLAERCRREGGAEHPVRLVNLYGPTEATVDVSFYDCPADPAHGIVRVPIGRPIDNTRLYVLGADDLPQPVGVAGELCIGGVGVSRGYLGRPELTTSKFGDDPFVPEGRLYRSGDLARWLADGTLEYLGRMDTQVKIRGNRVEPDEVAAALRTVPGIRDAIVVGRSTPDRGTVLAGYYVADAPIDEVLLRERLGRTLPAFMVPASFTLIDGIPLTSNGKADHDALPPPHTGPQATTGGQPRNRTEAVLAEVWARVLGHDTVGIHDDYHALGGDSITMLKVRAEAESRGLRFSLTDLLRNPTVAGLAMCTDQCDAPGTEAVPVPFALVADIDRARLRDAEDAYPLTRLQLGMLYHSRRYETSARYRDVFRYTLEMPWDESEFRRAFDRLTVRHPALRSAFDLSGSEPLQVVRPRVHGGLEVTDLRPLDSAAAEAEVRAHIEKRRRHPYAFDQAPLYLFRAHLRPAVVDLVLSFHHALLDGGSVATLLQELLQDYAHALGLDVGSVDDTPPPSAALHVRLEQAALRSEDARRYWREKLTGCGPLPIEAFVPHRPGTGHRPVSRWVELPGALVERVRHFAAEHTLPVKSVLFAAHSLTLAMLAGTRDVTTGLITHGRPELAGAERTAGLFLNTVPVRLDTARDSWLEVARESFHQEQEGHPHRHYPLSAIQEDHGGPVVETAFNYVHFHQLSHVLSLPGLRLTRFRTWEETDLRLLVNAVTEPNGSGMRLRIDCDGETFSAEQGDLLAAGYLSILRRLVEQPDDEPDFAVLAPLPVRAVPAEHPTVVARFADQAARTPDATAVVMGEERWSYAQLSEAAENVAGQLCALGAPVNARIGIAMDRTPRVMAVLMGVLRAGCAVVPLPPGYPAPRLAAMVEQAQPFRVVAEAPYAHLAGDPALVLPAETVTSPAAEFATQAGTAPTTVGERQTGTAPTTVVERQAGVVPESTAYVLFTSGSTGTPKGVAMPHRTLAGLVAWQTGAPSATPGGVTLQYAPLSFDISFQEIFSTLCSGGTLCLASDAERRDMPALLRLLDRERVEQVFLPPVAIQQLAEAAGTLGIIPRALRVLISCGEQLRVTQEIRALCAKLPGAVLDNHYGPTETHVVTAYTMTGDPAAFPALPPIGRAIDGAEVHLLDKRLRPVPVGAPGDIYLGGFCLADGYEGRPDLTKERFLPRPSEDGGAERRLYHTGDIGMLLPDGNVVFLGRADAQVKVRGFRVEPAEVELAITGLAQRYPGLRDAAVVARRHENDEAFLAAFLLGEGTEEDLVDIRERLRAGLPDYLVPSHLQWVSRFPLTPSGKRDDAALRRAPLTVPARTPDAGPRDAYEQALTEMLADALSLEAVGVHDNLFDLGGTSLTAMRLVVRIERRYGVHIALADFISAPTCAALAARLRDGGATAAYDPVVPIHPQGTRPPLFMIHPMGGNVLCYVGFARHLPGDQPVYALQAAGADPGTTPLRTVEELADSYLTALRTVQPHGPYSIGGWSFGGFVALEIARRLRAANEQVAHLLVLDTTALDPGPRAPHDDEAVLEWFFQDLLRLRDGNESPARVIPEGLGSGEEKFAYMARIASEQGVLPAGGSRSLIRRLFGVYRANWQAALAYRPPHEDHDLTLIRAAEPLPAVLASMHRAAGSRHEDTFNGWKAMTSGRIHVVGVPGDHLTIMEEPHVAHVAATVAGLIRTGSAPTDGES
ncbi:amino acid adenylation domain-containing protein [Streptomyces sp. HNM0645]|uniref:amino acid adenylation domain-containing protein n=1 Tax=Streptomyces sp. HNM0645 TaxID=2782343 RepID=UPI0024B7FB09|nr:non-ribosomal peptide synthetase [Streptomyces sp. HNM0645]MDI9886414.1 amino acid adenylation domain-containing protein [Streptomyces sp. HNM0645]